MVNIYAVQETLQRQIKMKQKQGVTGGLVLANPSGAFVRLVKHELVDGCLFATQ
jgi:hypothetical protein